MKYIIRYETKTGTHIILRECETAGECVEYRERLSQDRHKYSYVVDSDGRYQTWRTIGSLARVENSL
jgi:hypothetical protein